MRQQLLLLAGAIAIAMAGCASEETATTPSPTPASPAPAASPTASPAASQPFAKPLVAQKPATTATVPGLIQPTNPDERAKQVQANINAAKAKRDPFASIPVTVQGPQQRTQALVPPAPRVPNLPNPPQPGTATGDLTAIAPSGAPPSPSSPFPPSRTRPNRPTPNRTRTSPNTPPRPSAPFPTASRPPGASGTPGTAVQPAAPPPPPQPVLAPATEVSGIVYVSGEPQAIVRAPNERTSRYVRVGQRLSDGQILVKRIELNTGAEPLVILEENGVEVPKIVGEKPTPPPGSPAA